LLPLSEIQQETLDRLSALEGYLFDRAFVQQIVNEHQDQFGLYRDISENPNLDLRAYGEPRIQSIREHLQRAYYVSLTPVFARWTISNPK
jgi:predicted outer membrane protein